jgi:hypothetical protein
MLVVTTLGLTAIPAIIAVSILRLDKPAWEYASFYLLNSGYFVLLGLLGIVDDLIGRPLPLYWRTGVLTFSDIAGIMLYMSFASIGWLVASVTVTAVYLIASIRYRRIKSKESVLYFMAFAINFVIAIFYFIVAAGAT